MKICSTCKLKKDNSEFHKYKNSKDGLTHRCKQCVSRKKIIATDNKKCTECDKIKPLNDFYLRKNGKLGRSSNCKECYYSKIKKYRNNNIEKIRKYRNEWKKNKRLTDPLYKIINNMRCRIYDFLKNRNIQKNNNTFKIIGCTPNELKIYLESKFIEGMNWDNYGYYGWHVDHIIPLDSANTENEVYNLCHYTNLQPLWMNENLKKSYKLI